MIVSNCKPNQIVSPGGRWSVYSVSLILDLLYLYTLTNIVRKKTKSMLLIYLVVMLFIVNISNCTWQYSNYLQKTEACFLTEQPTIFN